jgi:hypothetical protein
MVEIGLIPSGTGQPEYTGQDRRWVITLSMAVRTTKRLKSLQTMDFSCIGSQLRAIRNRRHQARISLRARAADRTRGQPRVRSSCAGNVTRQEGIPSVMGIVTVAPT